MLVILIVSATSHGQSLTTGSIKGVVTDEGTGEPMPGVTITVGSQVAVTDIDGSYQITELMPGTYDVVFDMDVSKVTHGGVVVGLDNVTTLNQKIKLGESIIVKGTPPPIRLDSTQHDYHVTRPEIENIPHPGSTFESVIGGIGGAQNDGVGVAFSGSTSLENRYVVDGIDITGLTYGNVGTPVLNEFIQEIEVITGGYNAEYGRATGGIVNIVTRSGTDELRGSIFGTLTPGFLTAAAKTTPVNASSIDVTANHAYTTNFGFELGGPIIKKKAWFYLGVSPQLDATDYTRTTKRETDCRKILPSGALSSCAPENADGSPDLDPKTGFYLTDQLDKEIRTANSKSVSVVAKVNAQPTDHNSAQLSLIALPSSSTTPGLLGLPTSGTKTSGLTTDTAARWTSKFNDNSTEVEGLIAWHRSTLDSGSIDPSLNNTPLQILQDGNLGTWSGLGGESAKTAAGCKDSGPGDPYSLITNCPMQSSTYSIGGPGAIQHDYEDRREARISVVQRVHAAGTHEFKAGLDFEDDTKSIARLYSGGAVITNDIGADTVRVQRWVQLAAPGDLDPHYDQTCSTPDTSGGTGPGTMQSKSYRCAYLGGTVGSPGTQIGGQTINWAAYLRDSWQPIRNLTLNAGVRYEQQSLRYASTLQGTTDPLTGEHIGTNAMKLTGNFAPRLGVTYDPSQEGRSKIYASWGRFYESIPMDINDRSFGGEVSDIQTFATNTPGCGPIDPKLGAPDGNGCLTNKHPASEQLLGSSGVLVAPGIKAEYVDEILAGVEYAVVPEIVIGATFQHRTLGRVIEDVSTDGANTYIIANPGEWSADEENKLTQRIAETSDPTDKARLAHDLSLYKGIRIFDKPVRDYNAVELSVSRKIAPGLYLQGSYTYSRTEGNYPGSISYDNGQIDPNISSQYDLIELLENRKGSLPQDRPHSIKLDGYYAYKIRPKDTVTLGARIRAISGIPENALAGHYLYGANESFLLPRGQLGRTDFDHGVDIHLSYKRKLSAKTQAELFMDVFNVYNRQGTYDVDNTYAPYYKLSVGGTGGEQQNANPVSGGTYKDLIWVKEIDSTGTESAKPIGRNPNFHNATSRYAPASAQVGFRVTF